MTESFECEICKRIAQLRIETAGLRGKSSFSKQLGISPSTYDYYESSRVPPARILVRIAEVAKADLRWLLTGETSTQPNVPADHPVVLRAAELLDRRPDAAAPLAAFLDILAGSLAFPDNQAQRDGTIAKKASPEDHDDLKPSTEGSGETRQGPTAVEAPATSSPQRFTATSDEGQSAEEQASQARRAWIPILGRSAAGVPQFWSGREEAAGVTTLGELIKRHTSRPLQRVQQATVRQPDVGEDRKVQIIILRDTADGEPVEFIAADDLKAKYPDAFAVRIDGDSMSPEICHGDIVVLAPSVPAVNGRPAVVQLRGQIGVTCKLYRRVEQKVHLAANNERFSPQAFAADEVVWALRVLARVRSSHRRPN